MRYLYLPFSNFSADGAYTETVARYKRRGHTVIEHSRWRRPLSKLTADDVLIIMGHGDNHADRGLISVERSDRRGNISLASKTFNDLASQLKNDGLPKSHKIVKSLSCYGGGSFELDAQTDGLYKDNYDYFAELLAKALGMQGYSNIKVGGYPGTVGSTTDQKLVFFSVRNNKAGKYEVDIDGEYGVPTKGYIQWFDADGKRTTP